MDSAQGAVEGGDGDGLSRRAFMRRAGMLGAALAAVDLAALLDAHGLLPVARAQSADLTKDTIYGLVAFIVPGDDPYSVAQGERARGPGGVGAGAPEALIVGLDNYVAAPTGLEIPASAAVAAILNAYAQTVNPLATRGGFPSHFSRLSFDEKARVFEAFEGDPRNEGTTMRYVAGVLPSFVAFLSFSEVGERDARRRLTGRPVGWRIARYRGRADGHRELRGYWRGMRRAGQRRRTRKRWNPRRGRTRGGRASTRRRRRRR